MSPGEVIAFLVSFVASALLTWLVRRHALERGIMDVPNVRSSHAVAVPRGGGAAIAVTCTFAVAALTLWQQVDLNVALALAVGGVLVAVVGYLDDARGVSALTRFIVHIVAASIAAAALLTPHSPVGTVVLVTVAALWIVGIAWSINLFNFMDGIDGLAGSQAVFVAGATALLLLTSATVTPLAVVALVTAGACLGFLTWNWPPASIFMGDVGSGYLGFWLAALALALHADGTLSIWTSVVLNSAFIADASVTLVNRVARGARWYEAHRSHAYQLLSRRWRSHAKVTRSLWALNLAVVLPLAVLTRQFPAFGPAMAAGIVSAIGVAAALVGAGRTDE